MTSRHRSIWLDDDVIWSAVAEIPLDQLAVPVVKEKHGGRLLDTGGILPADRVPVAACQLAAMRHNDDNCSGGVVVLKHNFKGS